MVLGTCMSSVRLTHVSAPTIRRLIVVMAAVGLSVGCSITVPLRPHAVHQMAASAANGRYEEVEAVSIVRLPFSMLSLSASESLGSTPYSQRTFVPIGAFDLPAAGGGQLRYRILSSEPGCRPSQSEIAVLAEAMRMAYSRASRSLVPAGSIELRLVARDARIARTTLSLRSGRRVGLRFYGQCLGTDATRSAAGMLNLLAVSTHELSHVLGQLSPGAVQPGTPMQREEVADLSVGCLYEALEQSAQGREVASQLPLATYFEMGSAETGIERNIEAGEACRRWLAWARAAVH